VPSGCQEIWLSDLLRYEWKDELRVEGSLHKTIVLVRVVSFNLRQYRCTACGRSFRMRSACRMLLLLLQICCGFRQTARCSVHVVCCVCRSQSDEESVEGQQLRYTPYGEKPRRTWNRTKIRKGIGKKEIITPLPPFPVIQARLQAYKVHAPPRICNKF
jgi:hypothetical protein